VYLFYLARTTTVTLIGETIGGGGGLRVGSTTQVLSVAHQKFKHIM